MFFIEFFQWKHDVATFMWYFSERHTLISMKESTGSASLPIHWEDHWKGRRVRMHGNFFFCVFLYPKAIRFYLVKTGADLTDRRIIVSELLLDQQQQGWQVLELVYYYRASTTLSSELQRGWSFSCINSLSIAVSHMQFCKRKVLSVLQVWYQVVPK